jgi:hypothetical protein
MFQSGILYEQDGFSEEAKEGQRRYDGDEFEVREAFSLPVVASIFPSAFSLLLCTTKGIIWRCWGMAAIGETNKKIRNKKK